MSFLPKGPKPTPRPQGTYTLPNGVVVKNSLRKNQLTIAEKGEQLMDKYKIKFNPFLAKECGYSEAEIKRHFGLTVLPFTVGPPPAAPKTMEPAREEDETEDA